MGSSPRVRGAAEAEVEYPDHGGIIPACAGSSSLRNRSRRHIRDHPRVCGEQLFLFACAFALWGSSPRVRGADLDDLVLVMGAGIIPACAGSSNLCCASTLSAWDHPRACGEQRPIHLSRVPRGGSSPRVRGAAALPDARGHLAGIIPARAGSREARRHFEECPWDHPRACGEQNNRATHMPAQKGSSPRVRGAE